MANEKQQHEHQKPITSDILKFSQLGRSFSLKGEISGKEDLVIIGKFEGTISLEGGSLTVESESRVTADISAENITIKGHVQGNIIATGKVFIDEHARMIGDISASKISIMDGAQFKGSMRMSFPGNPTTSKSIIA